MHYREGVRNTYLNAEVDGGSIGANIGATSGKHFAKFQECRCFYIVAVIDDRRKRMYFTLILTRRVPRYAPPRIINFQRTQIFAVITEFLAR